MTWQDDLKADLTRDEGVRNKMYLDSRGIATIGIGHNLRDKGISNAAVNQIFQDDLADVMQYATQQGWYPAVADDSVRLRAFLNLIFQLGSLFAFPAVRIAAMRRDWEACADNLAWTDPSADPKVPTPWFTQSGDRAKRIVWMVRTGTELPA